MEEKKIILIGKFCENKLENEKVFQRKLDLQVFIINIFELIKSLVIT